MPSGGHTNLKKARVLEELPTPWESFDYFMEYKMFLLVCIYGSIEQIKSVAMYKRYLFVFHPVVCSKVNIPQNCLTIFYMITNIYTDQYIVFTFVGENLTGR